MPFEIDDLVPLRPTQCEKLTYPPSCPIVHTDFSRQQVTYGVIDIAFIRFDSREIVYQLKETTSGGERDDDNKPPKIVPESELQFGRGAPVWVSPPNGVDPVAATVLNAYVSPEDTHHEALYSVLTEDNWVLHFCSVVQFRARPTPSVVPKSPPEEESSSHILLPAIAEAPLVPSDEPTLSNPNNCILTGEASSITDSLVPDEENGNLQAQPRTSPPCLPPLDSSTILYREGEISELLTETSPSSSWLEGDCHSNNDLSGTQKAKQSTQEDDSIVEITPKRQKREGSVPNESRHTLVLPDWIDEPSVKECFHSNLVWLETETECKLTLRDGAMDPDSSETTKLFIDIDGHDDFILAAFCLLEDLFLDLFDQIGPKSLLMYDIAKNNRHYYGHNGNYVYQRECQKTGSPFQWMVFVDLPNDLACSRGRGLLVGGKGQGLVEMRGDTPCHLTVTDWPRSGVVVSGSTHGQIDGCIRRLWTRVARVRNKMEKS